MSLESLSYWAQIVGAAAVVLSLIYVAIQLRLANAQLMRSEMNAMLTHFSEVRLAIINDPDVARLWNATINDLPLTDPIDALRSETLIAEQVWGSFHGWDRTTRGLGDIADWRRGAARLSAHLTTTERGARWWRSRRGRWGGTFEADLEAVAAEDRRAAASEAPAVQTPPAASPAA